MKSWKIIRITGTILHTNFQNFHLRLTKLLICFLGYTRGVNFMVVDFVNTYIYFLVLFLIPALERQFINVAIGGQF